MVEARHYPEAVSLAVFELLRIDLLHPEFEDLESPGVCSMVHPLDYGIFFYCSPQRCQVEVYRVKLLLCQIAVEIQ